MPSHVTSQLCALARANHVFGTDEKRIRTENTVIDKSKGGLDLFLSKIADGARMCFSSAHHRRSARTGRRPRKFERHSSMYPAAPVNAGIRPLRAPRANHVFGTDEKRIRTKNRVMDKSKNGLGPPSFKAKKKPGFPGFFIQPG
jgi:hypothetical protein